MTRIKNIGSAAKLDREGYIINESSWEKVNRNYQSPIRKITGAIKKDFSKEIHSIYLRGSLPRGLGIEGVSDIDLLVVENDSADKTCRERLMGTVEKMGKEYPYINGIEVGFNSLKEVCTTSHFHIIPFMIKTYSILLYGENLQEKLPQYKADEKLANEHIVNLRMQIEIALEDLEGNEDTEDIKDCCMWIMKIFIRGGMALVMNHERTYTRDLYPAFMLFSTHYPEKEKEMLNALELAVNPSGDPLKIISFLKEGFGSWMIQEADRWLKEYNPSKLKHMPLQTR
ncbi:nucleotidyltransferase [Bacillus salacetis]|uniref:Nucleotidyltransferase n=1 Tax=Bacillus salacetis TaxID=2315464 RepID=A0A3A1R438_9BACI|nr:nucleotidyltransferase domain-containing protein [Bacillus salacetis]RIW37329.1 nucleotidyltransferase [Bacillus salacetis]